MERSFLDPGSADTIRTRQNPDRVRAFFYVLTNICFVFPPAFFVFYLFLSSSYFSRRSRPHSPGCEALVLAKFDLVVFSRASRRSPTAPKS